MVALRRHTLPLDDCLYAPNFGWNIHLRCHRSQLCAGWGCRHRTTRHDSHRLSRCRCLRLGDGGDGRRFDLPALFGPGQTRAGWCIAGQRKVLFWACKDPWWLRRRRVLTQRTIAGNVQLANPQIAPRRCSICADVVTPSAPNGRLSTAGEWAMDCWERGRTRSAGRGRAAAHQASRRGCSPYRIIGRCQQASPDWRALVRRRVPCWAMAGTRRRAGFRVKS